MPMENKTIRFNEIDWEKMENVLREKDIKSSTALRFCVRMIGERKLVIDGMSMAIVEPDKTGAESAR